MDTTAEQPMTLDTVANRLKMAKMMALITLALAMTYAFSPLVMRLALVIVGTVTAVYSLYNLLIFRYRKSTASTSA